MRRAVGGRRRGRIGRVGRAAAFVSAAWCASALAQGPRPPGLDWPLEPPRAAVPATPAPAEPTRPPDEPATTRDPGERERAARRARGAPVPVPPTTEPFPPPAAAPAAAAPPRIAIPRPGEPGGLPIALPTCGPAGCFDTEGRAWPHAGGTASMPPGGGRPCVRTGAAVTC